MIKYQLTCLQLLSQQIPSLKRVNSANMTHFGVFMSFTLHGITELKIYNPLHY